jgi:hypothetical protein
MPAPRSTTSSATSAIASSLVGERFTVADAYMFWALMVAPYGGISLGRHPAARLRRPDPPARQRRCAEMAAREGGALVKHAPGSFDRDGIRMRCGVVHRAGLPEKLWCRSGVGSHAGQAAADAGGNLGGVICESR